MDFIDLLLIMYCCALSIMQAMNRPIAFTLASVKHVSMEQHRDMIRFPQRAPGEQAAFICTYMYCEP